MMASLLESSSTTERLICVLGSVAFSVVEAGTGCEIELEWMPKLIAIQTFRLKDILASYID
jgi:hypothetical protein